MCMSTGIITAIKAILDLAWRFLPTFRIRRYRATEFSSVLRRYASVVSHFSPRFHAHLPASLAGPAPKRVFNCAHGPRALSYRFPPRSQGGTPISVLFPPHRHLP